MGWSASDGVQLLLLLHWASLKEFFGCNKLMHLIYFTTYKWSLFVDYYFWIHPNFVLFHVECTFPIRVARALCSLGSCGQDFQYVLNDYCNG